jgi:hypothetical protein
MEYKKYIKKENLELLNKIKVELKKLNKLDLKSITYGYSREYKEGRIPSSIINEDTIDKCAACIIESIVDCYKSDAITQEEIGKYIINLRSDYLPSKYYEIILNDKIAAMTYYSHLLNNNVFDLSDKLVFFRPRKKHESEILHFYKFTTRKTESIDYRINEFILFLNVMNTSYQQKIEYLDYLNEMYTERKNSLNTSWFDMTPKQKQWLNNYIKKCDVFKSKLPNKPSIHDRKDVNYIYFLSSIYALDISIHEKKLLILSMKKAWSQVKYREKIKKENKKNINVVVEESTVKKLKSLSKTLDMPINQIISIMTEQFFIKIEDVQIQIKEQQKKKRDMLKKIY